MENQTPVITLVVRSPDERASLAYAEMHIVLANLFSRFSLELTTGSHEGMEWVDRVVIHPKRNLRIKVKPRAIKQRF